MADGKLRLAARRSAEGFELRARRLSERAAAICPAKKDEARKLSESAEAATRDAARGVPADADALWAASRKTLAGDAPRARRLASLAARRYAKQAKLTLFSGVARANAFGISADGKRIAAHAPDGWVVLSAETLEPQVFLQAPPGPTPQYRGRQEARFSPRGDRLAILELGAIVLHDASSGARQKKLEWAGEEIQSFVFSSDGASVFSGAHQAWQGVVRRFDVGTGDSRGEYRIDKERGIPALAVHGSTLAVGLESGAIELVDANTLVKLRALKSGESPAALAFSPSGDRVACVTNAGSLEVWETSTGKSVTKATLERQWHDGYLGFSADGLRLRVRGGSWGETAMELDARTGRALTAKTRPRGDAILSADGSTLVVSQDRSGLYVVDAASGEVRVAAPLARPRAEGLAVANGHLAVARQTRSGSDSALEIWIEGSRLAGPRIVEVPGYKAVIALSPGGQRLVGNFGGRSVSGWDVASGSPIAFAEAPEWVDALAFGADVNVVRGAGGPFELHVFSTRAAEGKITPELRVKREGRFRALALSAEGAALVTGDGRLAFHDFAGDQLVELGDAKELRGLALSASGRVLVTASARGLERVELSGGGRRKVIAPRCTDGPVSISANGSSVLARCSYREIALVSASGIAMASVQADRVALSPDGFIAVTEQDGVISVFGPDLVPRLELELGTSPRTWIARAPSGEVELFGGELALSDRVHCRVGDRAFPWALCEDVLYRDHLVRDALSKTE